MYEVQGIYGTLSGKVGLFLAPSMWILFLQRPSHDNEFDVCGDSFSRVVDVNIESSSSSSVGDESATPSEMRPNSLAAPCSLKLL